MTIFIRISYGLKKEKNVVKLDRVLTSADFQQHLISHVFINKPDVIESNDMCYFSEKGKKSERKRIRKSFNKLFGCKHFSWWAWLYVRSNLWNYNAVLPWIWLRSNVKVRKKGSNIYKDSISINIWPNKIETSHIHTFTHACRSSNLQKSWTCVRMLVRVCAYFFWRRLKRLWLCQIRPI